MIRDVKRSKCHNCLFEELKLKRALHKKVSKDGSLKMGAVNLSCIVLIVIRGTAFSNS